MKECVNYFKNLRRLVVKVGSAVITSEDGLSREVIDNLSAELSRFRRQGYEVLLVSSGAIACGRKKLDFPRRDFCLSEKQALAATGQASLIQAYEEAFEKYNQQVAQILLTRMDLEDRRRYLLARNTLQTLLKWGLIPIINENDTVSVEEIQFGDNDLLAAMVVGLVKADILICLSDVDALYECDPRQDPKATRIRLVGTIDEKIEKMAGKKPGRFGRGGMVSKIRAAKMVTTLGVPMIIAPGREPLILERIFAGEDIGTFFIPERRSLSAKKFWIAYHKRHSGRLVIDKGAVKALCERQKSLLPAGIKKVDGKFNRGDCVECIDEEGQIVAVGISNYSSEELKQIIGCHTREIFLRLGFTGQEEVIHRDNMVVFNRNSS